MSERLTDQMNRRQFLTIGLAVAGGAVTLQPDGEPDDTQRSKKDFTRWAFLSDTHVGAHPGIRFRGFYPHQNLQRTTDQIGAALPDGLVITGDLTRSRGSTDAYESFKALLAPIAERRPIHLGIGNHDNRDNFLRVFTPSRGRGNGLKNRHIIATDAGPVRLVVLDTHLYSNVFPGLLGKLQRIWLETFLEASDDKPTLLFLHHSPRADLLDAGRLLDIVAPARKVKAVVYGHSHKYKFSTFDGIHFINLPAVGYNFTGAQPVGWVEARLTGAGGEFILHAVGGNRNRHGRVTTVRWRA